MTVDEGAFNRVFLWTVAALALAVIYAPPIYLVAISFNASLQPGLPGISDLSLRWYAALPKETALMSALWQSLLIALVTGIAATLLSLLAALAYFELKRARSLWFLAMVLPMFVPGVIAGLALSAIFTQSGIKSSAATVIAGHLLWAMPFAFVVILTSFAAVKPSYLMAADDLGASRWRQFRDITLPLVRPGLVSAFVFAFLLSLNEFTRAFYLSGRQNTLPVVLFGKMNSGASPVIYAISGAILLLSILVVAGVVTMAGRARAMKAEALRNRGNGS